MAVSDVIEEEHLQAKTKLTNLQIEVAEYNWRWEKAKDRRRVYNIMGGIDDAEEYNYRSTLTRWLDYDPDAAITVVINSGGGAVSSGFAIFDFTDAMIRSGADITTVAIGRAASMAALMLQMGTTRAMTSNSYVMVHDLSIMPKSRMTTAEMRDEADLMKEMNERYVRLLARKASVTEDEIQRKIHREDWWLTAEEALEVGFIDEIGHGRLC